MRTEYNGMSDVKVKYPAVYRTIQAAREVGFKVTRHCAYFTKRGAIYQHWLCVVENDNGVWWSHSDLKGRVAVIKEIKKNQAKKKTDGNKVIKTN